MSRIVADMNTESEIAKFLDRHYYPKISVKNGTSVKRVTDKHGQLQGKDIIVHSRNSTYIVDEKCASYFPNRDIPTFAFELSFLSRESELREGWFINDQLETTHYMIMWITIYELNKPITLSNIKQLECMIIEKDKLREWLVNVGYPKTRLIAMAAYIRKSKKAGKIPIPNADFYFYSSNRDKYTEHPINIIIRKQLLKTISDRHFVVTRKEIKYLS